MRVAAGVGTIARPANSGRGAKETCREVQMLIGFVTLYLIFTVSIGLWAARRVRSSTDYALAGRSLPLAMIVTTTFATWFGSETVLGISSKFMEGAWATWSRIRSARRCAWCWSACSSPGGITG